MLFAVRVCSNIYSESTWCSVCSEFLKDRLLYEYVATSTVSQPGVLFVVSF